MDSRDEGLAEGSGLSRRDLIKRAAAAGTIAWATPVILGSVASPAGAGTPGPCVPYYVKLIPGGACYSAAPGSGSGRVCGTTSTSVSFPTTGCKCGSACTASCTDGANAGLTPSSSLSGSYYQVSLTSGSWFSSEEPWALGGRYDTNSNLSSSSYTKLCPGGATGDGGYTDAGGTGYVKSSVTFGTTAKPIRYIYIRFCRSS